MALWIASAMRVSGKDMQTLIQDLRYSVRQLIKSPGFTLTAVISLALGIGATTAVFSVIYAALIDPYRSPPRTALCGCRGGPRPDRWIRSI
jgi:hypothetical protein